MMMIDKDKDKTSLLKIDELSKTHVLYALNELTSGQSYVFYDKYNRPGHITNIDYFFYLHPLNLIKNYIQAMNTFINLHKKNHHFILIKIIKIQLLNLIDE